MQERDAFESRLSIKTNLLGQLLIKNGMISHKQLEDALSIQKDKGGKIGDILIAMGLISQETVSMALANQTEAVYIPVEKYKIPKETLNLIPRDIAIKYQCVPLEKISGVLAVVMANPLDKDAIQEIERVTQCKLICMIGTKVQIDIILKTSY